MSDRGSQILAEILLIAVAAVWGWTFVMVKDAVALYPTLQFLSLRFLLAAGVMGCVVVVGRWRRGRAEREGARPGGEDGSRADQLILAAEGPAVLVRTTRSRHRATVLRGVLMGLALGAGYIFQTFGLEKTSASNAGFITGLFVVLVPLMYALVWRSPVDMGAIVGVVLATVGLFLLSGGTHALRLGGDGLVFLCAVSFSIHILLTSTYVQGRDPAVLTLLQLGTVGVLTTVLAVLGAATGMSPSLSVPSQPSVLFALGVTSVFASAAAFYVQTYAQRHAPPTRTAVILTMEPVFAGLFGYLLAGERLGAVGWLGAGLILGGMLISELWPSRRLLKNEA